MYSLLFESRATEARAALILQDAPVCEMDATDETRSPLFKRRHGQEQPARPQPQPRARYTSRQPGRKPSRKA